MILSALDANQATRLVFLYIIVYLFNNVLEFVMKLLSMDSAMFRRRVLRLNIVVGLLTFAVAAALSITGEYSSLADRKVAESLYNQIALAGVLYAASSWIFCVMTKPFWFPVNNSENQ